MSVSIKKMCMHMHPLVYVFIQTIHNEQTESSSDGKMVSKLDYMSDFESHWVSLSCGLVPHLSKKLSKSPQ